MSDRSFDCDERTDGGKSRSGKLRIALNVAGESIAEKTARSYYEICLAEPLHDKIAQARAHGITYEQRAGEHRDRRRHTEDDREIGAPVVKQAAFE